MSNANAIKRNGTYVYISIGIATGLVAGLITMPRTDVIESKNDDSKIEVGKSVGDSVQPSSIGADQIGSAILWNQQGANGSGVQNVTGIDQIISNSEINIK